MPQSPSQLGVSRPGESTLLVNGRIYRDAFDRKPADALMLSGEKILWVGDRGMAPVADKQVDLMGATVLPGLTDSHLHVLANAQNRLQLSLFSPEETSIPAVLTKLAGVAQSRSAGEWVAAADFDEGRLKERRPPSRWEIDSVIPDRPVFIRRYCGHAAVVNSAALRKVGLGDHHPDPEGGHFGRADDGTLDGSAYEKAAEIIFERARTVGDDALITSIQAVIGECNTYGLVAGVEAAVGFSNGFAEEHRIWEILRERRRLPMRLGFMLQLDPQDARRLGHVPHADADWQTISLKYFADGIIGGRTAAVSEPYLDTGTTGFFARDPEILGQIIVDAHGDGWQVAVHAIGDLAIESVITAFEAAQAAHPDTGLRHRIEHCFCPPKDGFLRMQRLGTTIVMQPGFLIRMGRSIRSALGARADRCYPGRSALDAGVSFAASSDSPTGPLSPWQGMVAAIDRCARSGLPIGPSEGISFREALAAYTFAGAYIMRQEKWRGAIAEGMAADLAILAIDPFEAELDALFDIRALATMVRGEIVHGGV